MMLYHGLDIMYYGLHVFINSCLILKFLKCEVSKNNEAINEARDNFHSDILMLSFEKHINVNFDLK